MRVIVCKKCGHENPDGATFCENCRGFLEWIGERGSERTKAGVKLLIAPTTATVDPGSIASYDLSVQNTGSVVDSFLIQIPDAKWIIADPGEVDLFPGKSGKARIDAKPPRDPSVRAGEHLFSITATSRADPRITGEEIARVAVGEFTQVKARLDPVISRSSEGGSHTVLISNLGNHAIRGGITAGDPAAALAFDFLSQTFSTEPGESTSIQVAVRPRSANSATQDRPHTFQIQIEVAGSPAIKLDGTMVHEPTAREPAQQRKGWLPWVLIAAGALLLTGSVATYAIMLGPR